MKDNLKKYKISILVVILTLAGFGSGLYFGEKQNVNKTNVVNNYTDTSTSSITNVDMSEFWSIWKTLDARFVNTHKNVKTATTQDKVYGAIKGLVAAYGDPYTVFMPPADNAVFTTNISGNFEGVGMELGMKDTSIVVIAPLKDTPAYKAGVKSGDIITLIDEV